MSEEIFERFKREMLKKFSKRMNKLGNTATPWKDADSSILLDRIVAEFQELIDAYYSEKQEELAEECIDLANQCLFLWAKLKGVNE